MSVAVVQSSSPALHLDRCSWMTPVLEQHKMEDDPPPPPVDNKSCDDEERPGQFDIWNAIQSKKAAAVDQPAAPYVHPLVRRSSSLMSQKSLKICTESLGSETGSDDFSSFLDDLDFYYPPNFDDEEKEEGKKEVDEKQIEVAGGGGAEVNYHCSIVRRSPPRSFPPPLPSISGRTVPCLHMRPRRLDGRLVVEAVPVPSKNYLHAQRVDGRLLLSFTDETSGDEPGYESDASKAAVEEQDEIEITQLEEEEEDEEELDEKSCYEGEEEEEEEEVEVVDRGTVIEVKVSTQPQQQSGAMKVHRSSLVINKFVGGTPLSDMTECRQPATNAGNTSNQNKQSNTIPSAAVPRRASSTATTAAAAAVAASTLGTVTNEGCDDYGYGYGYGGPWAPLGGQHPQPDNKLLFTSKLRNRDELLHNMRRCSQLRRPLFIREPYCVATS